MDLTTFLEQHDPQVIVYDVAPPYDAHWRFLQHVRHLPGMPGIFVITSTNAQRLQEIVGTVKPSSSWLAAPTTSKR